jgi:iron complex transport system ATP-binding protein
VRLDIENLSFSRPRRKILEAISLSLRPGELAGFLGPNGSGKSTFLKNLLGFLKPSGGRVLFSGETGPGTELARGERARRLSFVPQLSGMRAGFTVAELVLMGRLPHLKDRWAGDGAGDRRKAAEVMETLGIASLAARSLGTLSGGELQKAALARCLAQEADIMLLDEATSGLDLNHSVEIMELLLRKARGEGTIILAVLHDVNLASQYCDRIFLLKQGRLRFAGPPAEVLTEETLEEIYGIRVAVRIDENGRPVALPRRVSGGCASPPPPRPEAARAADAREIPGEAPREARYVH